jgi:mitotic spindle assembly checkpoint protein MAD2
MATQQSLRNTITLKGSTQIVTEFFGYAVYSILYQRAVYPPHCFDSVQKYGLTMLVANDEKLRRYLENVLKQLEVWLMEQQVKRIVVAVVGSETGQTLERWTFAIDTDKELAAQGSDKPQSEITREMQAIIRQITASVTFLPLLDEPCQFELLIYTDKEAEVPREWEETDAKLIIDAQEVRLRSFTTKIHKVDSMVAYKKESEI